jgi:hypothetical protein
VDVCSAAIPNILGTSFCGFSIELLKIRRPNTHTEAHPFNASYFIVSDYYTEYAEITSHSVFNMLLLVSSDFCTTLYFPGYKFHAP